ncbi:hypothetical protein D3C71_2042430 [compost metagenome]
MKVNSALFDMSNFVPIEPVKLKRGKKWTKAELEHPKSKECKYCHSKLKHAHWQRMQMCRTCHEAKRYLIRMF